MASPSVHRFLGLFLFACFLPFTPARLRHQCSDYGLTSDNSHTLPSPPLLASWFHVPKAGLDFGHYLWWYAGMDSDDHEAAMNKVSPQGHKPLTGQPRDCFLLRPATTPLLAMDECGVVTGKLTSKALPSPLLVRSEKNLSIVCKCYNTVGFLRDPQQRLISMYFHQPRKLEWFVKQAVAQHASLEANDTSLADRVTSLVTGPYASCALGGQTKMLIGAEVRDCRDLTPADIALAVTHLRTFSFIGITELWDLSLCTFQSMFGQPHSRWVQGALVSKVHTGLSHASSEQKMLAVMEKLNTSPASPTTSTLNTAVERVNEEYRETAMRNPRCEGLEGREEALCALAEVRADGKAVYRAFDLLSGTLDCADIIVFQEGVRLFEQQQLQGIGASPTTIASVRESLPRKYSFGADQLVYVDEWEVPTQCSNLAREVRDALGQMGEQQV